LRIPAKEIVDAAHDAGALVLLDGAQTTGHIALDLTAMGVDFYATSGQKWLGGPGGTGAVYVRPDRRDALIPQFRAPGLDFTEGFALYSLASLGAVDRAGYGEAVRLHNSLGKEHVESHNMALASQSPGPRRPPSPPSPSMNGPMGGTPPPSARHCGNGTGWSREPCYTQMASGSALRRSTTPAMSKMRLLQSRRW
jgi:hypothetical protein